MICSLCPAAILVVASRTSRSLAGDRLESVSFAMRVPSREEVVVVAGGLSVEGLCTKETRVTLVSVC